MAQDVFISYSTEDREVADKACAALEAGGIKCWIAPRDVPYGADYEEAIMDGIASSRLLVLVLSSHSNASPHVKREIQNACAGEVSKPVIPLRIEEIEYNKALRYYLGSAQWLDAATPPLEQHLGRLVERVRSMLPRADEAARPERPAQAVEPTAYGNTPNPPPAEPVPSALDSFKGTGDGTPVVKGTGDGKPVINGTGDGRKPFPFALVAAGVGALVLVVALVAFFALRTGGVDTNANTANAVNTNAVAASPTPQRTPTATPAPKASPAPTPRVVFPSRNLNLRRIPNR